jgi:hypothetical protein
MKTLLRFTLALVVCIGLAVPALASDYVGSNKCFSCHQEQFNYWQASGHPYKIRIAEKARYSGIPLPPGYAWEDIAYVIGGANKKARFIDREGYIITKAKDGSEAKTQYNLQDGSWSFYHKNEKKPYKCGPCHMTNYKKDGNQDGLPGMIGTWSENGIGCEECHGAGEQHVAKPSNKNIKIDSSADACAKCHQRGGTGPKPMASGGFIKHHEQINELRVGSHKDLSCTECHNPHQRAILAEQKCAECHDGEAAAYAKTIHGKSNISCVECHMPRASKSAIKTGEFAGDVRTHIFKISTDPKASLFYTEEKDGKKNTYASGALTLDYVCLNCHQSRDKNWAAKYAKGFHK